jgi:hypothetical protein
VPFGPSLLFDKSFLQSLSVDEAAMLDQFYRSIITPVFFTETLADVAKPENKGRSPEAVVGGLAERTPVCQGAANASHWAIAIDDLMGNHYPLDGRPVVAGGIPVEARGKKGLVYEKSPETEAFERWQAGRFASLERDFAARWRRSLASVNLPEIAQAFKAQLRKEDRPKSLEQAKELASRLLATGGMNFRSFQLTFHILDVPKRDAFEIVRRWKAGGARPLSEWAPFAAHCVEVDLFFYLSMSNGLISDQRPSNLMDMAYLYYLPFAEIFVSSDKLHRAVAPLFLNANQQFVWGPELKADLKLADEHFSALPEAERARGLFLLASAPPETAALITGHWDKFLPGLRTRQRAAEPRRKPEKDSELIDQSNAFIEAAAARRIVAPPGGEPDHLIIQRFIPKMRGKWRMFSKEFEEENDKAERERPH